MHVSVLLDECIKYLNLKNNSTIVDCTLGYGGHSSEILKRINEGHLYCFDQDSEAIKYSENRLNKINNNYTIINSNFVNIKVELEKMGISKVDGILYDLGVSSPQLDEDLRGFSFHKDAKLDMRMNQEQDLSAYEVINQYSYERLVDILRKYGEEKYAPSIVKGIINNRPINTTLELVEVIKNSVPEKYKRDKHPARRTFQAIRIEVNDELNVFESSLKQALDLINIGGRICVITFHSLEDKICKELFKSVSTLDDNLKGLPIIPDNLKPKYRTVKVLEPTDNELKNNNRARSAKLRIIERLG